MLSGALDRDACEERNDARILGKIIRRIGLDASTNGRPSNQNVRSV
jgi:hypothetical protein